MVDNDVRYAVIARGKTVAIVRSEPWLRPACGTTAVEQFIAQPAVEALDETVLSTAAGCNEGWPDGLIARSANHLGAANSAPLSIEHGPACRIAASDATR